MSAHESMISGSTEAEAKGATIIAVVNQKGGVGKTTTAINLATAIAACGKRILIVDLDPQGNASTGFGIDRASRDITSYEVLLDDVPLRSAIVETAIPGLHVVPSNIDLSGAELELVNEEERTHRLKNALHQPEILGAYDYVMIDCPPSLSLLTLNALVAAKSVIVPLQTEFFALEGLSLLIKTVERVRNTLNPDLDIEGIILTMFDRRNTLSRQVALDVQKHMGDKVFATVIPRNVRISEAPSHGKPALLYDFHCPGSQAYIRLARELLKREQRQRAA